MSIKIAEIEGYTEVEQKSILSLRRFSGGSKRGQMLHLNISTEQRYAEIELTKAQVTELKTILCNMFDNNKYPSE